MSPPTRVTPESFTTLYLLPCPRPQRWWKRVPATTLSPRGRSPESGRGGDGRGRGPGPRRASRSSGHLGIIRSPNITESLTVVRDYRSHPVDPFPSRNGYNLEETHVP